MGNLVDIPFDGDEMNMHLPQNELAETELKMLAATPYQIVSPAGNAPIIGIYQDSMLGTFQFTREEIKFTPLQAMNLLMCYNKVDVNMFNDKKEITNFDILSQIMPPITLKYKNKFYEENEIPNNKIVIENGIYKSGHIEKSVLGGSTKGIIHRIYNDYGCYASAEFIDNLQGIITEYMKTHSFSVGISDLISDKATTEKILNEILAKKMEVKKIMDKVHLGVFENDTTSKNIDAFESQVNGVLNKATEEAGKIGRKSLHKSNRFVKIINSGSKGNHLNISQMISCLGQQNVDGKRIPYGFDSRTLPHFLKFDDSPNSRGFIENSYISGLTAPELFFHAMGGRIGLIDTAVKTSQTGYIQRRLIKGLEDLRVDYDMTVRNSKGKIVQFAYGDDGFDSTKVEVQNLPFSSMSIEDIYMHYDILGTNSYDKDVLLVYSKSTVDRMNKQKEETKAMCKKYIDKMLAAWNDVVSAVFANKNESKVYLPVAFQHTINNIQGNLGLGANTMVDITPLEAFELIEEYYSKLAALNFSKPTYLFEIMYYFHLTPRELLTVKRFHRKALVVLLETVLLKYKQALVHPGEMVGVIAGQSIGEPTTQLTLNSVVYETEIIVRDINGNISRVQIGDFVTNSIAMSSKVDYMEDKDTTYAEMAYHYQVPSATEDGYTIWCTILAVTQHPVVNEDGTNTMVKVTTKGGREVIVTQAKSVLQLIDGRIQEVAGKDLYIGDYLPVSRVTYKIANEKNLEICDDIIPNMINGQIIFEHRSGRFPDIEFDEIVRIEHVSNTTPYAYDLTVEYTKNFDIANGLCLRDTFHNAGVASKSNVTRGVPRIEEILRLAKSPKNSSLTVYLKKLDETMQEKATKYANMMEHTRLVDVVNSIQICFDPDDKHTRMEEDRELLEQFYEFEKIARQCNGENEFSLLQETNKSKWVIRMEMDAETLLDKNITMDDIHFAIKNSTLGSDVDCVYSDYNMAKLVFRVRMNIPAIKKKNFPEPLDQTDNIFLLKNFQDNLLNNIVLRGISGIDKVHPRKMKNMLSKQDGKYVQQDIWVLDTTGTNLLDTLGQDFIDYTRTYSNDIKEMYDVLGIEAARQTIFNEMVEVMEFSDVYINYHHMSILCDRMTTNKDMVSIFRGGILADNIGPIAKSTFEVHTEVLLDAARHGEFDHMRGVSANVMCGQNGYFGTNAFNVVLDLKKMDELESEEVYGKTLNEDIDDMFGKMEKESDLCPTHKIKIKNNIENIKRKDVVICDDDYNMGF
jgi:DNA-directed RNA polymerase beta' subunit